MPVEQTLTFFAEERAGVDIILTVLGNMHRIVEQLCDGLAAARIAGQQAIAANIAFDTMDMKLLIKLLHEKAPFFILQHYSGAAV